MAGERLYPEPEAVFELAALIRKVDGNHDLGATELAEAIIRGGYTLSRSEPDYRINPAEREYIGLDAATPPEPPT